MKILIAYPPLDTGKGVPLLGQNRQFQWFNSPTYIYPIVSVYAAALLKSKGYEVFWDDYIAEEKTYRDYLSDYHKSDVDVEMIETKTSVVKLHWKIVSELKKRVPDRVIVMVGDHVTELPEEAMAQCPVYFILIGGNYDFPLLNRCDNLQKNGGKINAEELDAGIYYREDGVDRNIGQFILSQNLNDLPMVDRELTKWKLYSEKNGIYTMAARDFWHHKYTFCSWITLHPKYLIRFLEKQLDEIGVLIEKYGVREIMDDSGAFSIGKWLRTFCRGMIKRGYNKKVIMDRNMRFGVYVCTYSSC